MSPTPTPRQKSALTALFVHKTRRVGKHYDNRGHGLYLCVSDTGSKRWEQRITLDTRCRYLGLGRYPDVSLREARKAVARERSVGSPSSQAMDLYMSSTLPVVKET